MGYSVSLYQVSWYVGLDNILEQMIPIDMHILPPSWYSSSYAAGVNAAEVQGLRVGDTDVLGVNGGNTLQHLMPVWSVTAK